MLNQHSCIKAYDDFLHIGSKSFFILTVFVPSIQFNFFIPHSIKTKFCITQFLMAKLLMRVFSYCNFYHSAATFKPTGPPLVIPSACQA